MPAEESVSVPSKSKSTVSKALTGFSPFVSGRPAWERPVCLGAARLFAPRLGEPDGHVKLLSVAPDGQRDALARLVGLIFEGVIASSEKAEEIREVARKAFSSPEIQNWYSGEWTLFNECAIIYKEKGVLQTRRPDRVMMKDGQVVVVDFKFGKENLQYNKQVKGYMQLLTKMGYKNITGYLWYVDEELIVKVK